MKCRELKIDCSLNDIWWWLIWLREDAEECLPADMQKTVKEECDDLFCQASGGRFPYHPSRALGGFDNSRSKR